MRLLAAIAFLTLSAVAYAADAAPLPSPHQVDIPLSAGTLHAQLYKPDGNGPFPNLNCRRRCFISCSCMTLTSEVVQLLQSPAQIGLPCFRFCQAYHKRPHSQIRVNHLLYPRNDRRVKYGRRHRSICNLSPLQSRSSQNQSIKALPFRLTKAPQ